MRIPAFLRKREIARLQRMAKVSYFDGYLQSEWWKKRRARALKRAGYKCEITSDPNSLEVHHTTYEHVGDERDDELIVLAEWLHERVHQTGRGKWTRSRLLRDRTLVHQSHWPTVGKKSLT